MATLTLKNFPDELYRRLKERASSHRRSLNSEAIVCLEQVLEPRPLDLPSWLEEVRALRRRTPGTTLTDAFLDRARREGRP